MELIPLGYTFLIMGGYLVGFSMLNIKDSVVDKVLFCVGAAFWAAGYNILL